MNAMAAGKTHDYHILPPDLVPLATTIGAFTFTSGMVLFMPAVRWCHGRGWRSCWPRCSVVLQDRERPRRAITPVVQLHQRYGMILFIASEVMFFVGWFWAFFDFSLFPSEISKVVGGHWPLKNGSGDGPFDLPLLNTLILLCRARRSHGRITA
jgi:cytochrome c oxidase subunit 3